MLNYKIKWNFENAWIDKITLIFIITSKENFLFFYKSAFFIKSW